MKKNVGSADSIIRIVLGIVLFLLFIFKTVPVVWGYIFLALAALLIITAILGVCPLYSLLRISSFKAKDKQ